MTLSALHAPRETTALREAARVGVPSYGRLVAIASGKGGVGKTWFAITLAQALAAGGRRVLLVDGDFGLANIDVQLGLMPRRDLAAYASGQASLDELVLAYAPPGAPGAGFSILPGRSGSPILANLDPMALGRLVEELRRLPGYDTILVDLGAGIDRATRWLAASADTLLVVTTDEPTALTDAYAVIKLESRDRAQRAGAGPGDVRLVVNQAATAGSGEKTYATLSRACSHFLGAAPRLAGVVRRDVAVREAIRRQTGLLTRQPDTPAAVDVRRIAAAFGPPASSPPSL